MDRAIAQWLARQNGSPTSDDTALLKKLRRSYTVYGDLVILPSNAFASDIGFPGAHNVQDDNLRDLYRIICQHLKTTHVATTRPIPLTSDRDGVVEQNILRAPVHFAPLYGDFGPSTASSPPTLHDFDAAHWVTAKQNGIYQTWAPRWTMFSRGNVSEKARLLTLTSVVTAVEEGKRQSMGCCAVDLYVGIGYFAFSYLKAGVDVVLGWELNGWSVEGARRGSERNGWKVTPVGRDDEDPRMDGSGVRLFVFDENNTRASRRVDSMRQSLPPIRHVNCGLLPSSEGSWRTAINVLDDRHDGWVHVHENFAVAEIEAKAERVRSELQQLVDESTVRKGGPGHSRRRVTIDQVNRLKSYAPGVMHCVIDIHISKSEPS